MSISLAPFVEDRQAAFAKWYLAGNFAGRPPSERDFQHAFE